LDEDQGDNTATEKGVYATIGFHWDDAAKVLTIGDRHGKFGNAWSREHFVWFLSQRTTHGGDLTATLTRR